MAEVTKTILLEYDVKTGKLIDENGKVIRSFKQLKTTYGEAQKAQEDLARSEDKRKQKLKELNKLQEDQARSAGLAGAAAFELGRTISDLPFGLVAVSNNISQLGTLFAALVANAKGLTNALKLLWAQVTGPAGILIAFQVLTAAITFFAQRSDKAKKAANEISSSLREEAAAIEVVTKKLEQGNITLEERLDILERYGIINKQIREGLEEVGLTEEQQNEVLEKRNVILEKQAALEARRKMTQEGLDPIEERAKAEEELFELEGKLEEERKTRIEVLNTARRVGNITQEGFLRGLAKINNDIDSRLLENAGAINVARAKINGSLTNETELKAEIFDLEKGINTIISDRIKLIEAREKAEEELANVTFDLREELLQDELNKLEDSEVQNVEARRRVIDKLFKLELERLEAQKQKELEGIEDPQTIKAINDKFKKLSEIAGIDFRNQLEKAVFEPIDVSVKPKLTLKDLLEGTEKTDAQKWAAGEVEKVGKAVTNEFQKRQASKGERNFFVDTFGVSEENMRAGIEAAQMGLNTIADVFAAQAEREIAIETNRTNKLNDQLKQRLANEQLTADQRDKINQEIARNEAELVAKENEINKRRFEQEKAVNVAMAVVDTFSAATGVLSDTEGGSFARIAGMIAVISAGLANVAMISKQQFTGKAMPSPNLTGQGTSAGSIGPSFNVVGRSQANQLADAVEAALGRTPVRSYVVSSDVTSAQALERKIVEGASI